MKKIFTLLLLTATIYTISNAQTLPINNPTVFVKEDGASTGYGLISFTNAISSDQFMSNVYSNVYSGDITVYFAGGDYYTDFKFWDTPSIIQSVRMYGGFNPRTRNYSLDRRDFESYETVFHAVSEHMVWFEGIGYNNPNGWNTCIVDGITLTSDGTVSFAAMALVGGDHIVSQCKFENFQSTDLLIWLETGGNTVTFTNCLFDNNDVRNLMALCTNINLINITVADNILVGDMFLPYNHGYSYLMQNTIIYGNSNMTMSSTFFDVYNSILENYESWVNDMGSNQYSTDPIFIYTGFAPYSCDYYSSPAISAGDGSFITTLATYYSSDIMDYDVANLERYWDIPRTTVDIGAYQSGYDDGSTNYDAFVPVLYKSKAKKDSDNTSNHIVWSNNKTIYVEDNTDADIYVYNTMGQLVYNAHLHNGYNSIPTTLTNGIYVVSCISSDGSIIQKKSIFIK